jgi:poly(U)-binding-splicing factor PUF60
MLVAPVDGPVSSNALAIRNNSELATINKDVKKAGTDKKSLSLVATGVKRKRKLKIHKERKPKVAYFKLRRSIFLFQLNTAGAMAAVFKAGAINDQMQAAHLLNDEATLASQEHVEIRGNDARHMLMHKLMRTNRSTVMVLKNMVDVNGVDEELEDEIRDECTKYGTVTDVSFSHLEL